MTKKRLRKIEMKKMDRECWDLDMSFINWLEPRLKQYVKRGGKIVDLTYHKITVDGIERDQLYWINEMLTLCDLIHYEERQSSFDNDIKENEMRIGRIWAEVLPYMWW